MDGDVQHPPLVADLVAEGGPQGADVVVLGIDSLRSSGFRILLELSVRGERPRVIEVPNWTTALQ